MFFSIYNIVFRNCYGRIFRIAIFENRVHPRENSKQQDGKRRGSRATFRTSSCHLGCSPLRAPNVIKQSRRATHKTYCYSRNIARFEAFKMAAKIQTGSNANNIYSIIASWNFGRALAANYKKLFNFAGRIDWVDWMGLITASSISIRHRGPKKVGSQRKAFYSFALSIWASPHDLYNGLYLERMRGQIGVTWTLRIYQLPSLAHLLYRHFVSSETFGNRPWPEKRAVKSLPKCTSVVPFFVT